MECSLRSHPRVDCSFPGISNLTWFNFTGGVRSWYWLGSLPYLSLRWEEVRGGLKIPASDEGRRSRTWWIGGGSILGTWPVFNWGPQLEPTMHEAEMGFECY